MKSVPDHLKKYVVDQNYDRYTPEDQAVWRYIMRQLTHFLKTNAHPCYLDGLKRTGISIEEIPKIEEMNDRLQEFGWGAVPVSGFIPPAAFMEFQSLGFLPIASDMRSVDHILYTPAPDIVHEAAGHAPILIDHNFASYLKSYANIANKAIISHEDLALYEAIRLLSDAKENPNSTIEEISSLEKELEDTVKNMSFVSEANLLGRMNWWTAEYGLIGELGAPKIFGAGLLSSIGESEHCLQNEVKKITLTVDCVDYSYDITEQQPQLFVTPDFETLTQVLEKLADRMAFRKGSTYGLKLAQEAKTVNTVELDTGLQISGTLVEYLTHEDKVSFIRFDGPTQICSDCVQLDGHEKTYHSHGYSTPIGSFTCSKSLSDWTPGDFIELKFESGIQLSGELSTMTYINEKPCLFKFANCQMNLGERVLFAPEWGDFDLSLGDKVTSVFGGPADRTAYGDFEKFSANRVPVRQLSEQQKKRSSLYSRVRDLRKNLSTTGSEAEVVALIDEYRAQHADQWLIGVELLELTQATSTAEKHAMSLKEHLESLKSSTDLKKCIEDGIELAGEV